MVHHVSLGTNSLERARAFYEPVLKVLGLRIQAIDAESLDFGTDHICFSLETPVNGAPATVGNGVHVAFAAPDRAAVDAFYKTALQLGGKDAGPPGPRPQYSPHYYGAFVLDPDGNKIEAVTERPD
ncbi:MAG: VOC family protein [Gammaproteobacteria bacterium]